MTLEQITKEVLRELNEEIDAQTLEEFEDRVTSFVNEGCRDLYEVVRPFRTDIAMPEQGIFAIAELPYCCTQIIRIRDMNGKEIPAVIGDNSGELLIHQPCQITYEYLPADIKSETDRPALPDGFHHLLVLYAVFREHLTGSPARQERGIYYKQLYDRAKAQIVRNQGACGRYIQNKWVI